MTLLRQSHSIKLSECYSNDQLVGIKELLRHLSASRQGSFLAVLKRFGHNEGNFSFPKKGYTLSLDFPYSSRTLNLLKELDEISIRYGGRFYLAKDSRISRESFRMSEKRAKSFLRFRQTLGISSTFSSEQSKRVDL